MPLIADTHVHTRISCDSDAIMSEYTAAAADKNVGAICFTDHIDFNPNDDGCGFYDADSYFRELALARRQSQKPLLLSGIELSEPHLYRERYEPLLRRGYDFVIGSVHWIGDLFPSRGTREKYTVSDYCELYWREVAAAVRCGGFDSLGHIDFPKRYYGEIVYDEGDILSIFSDLLESGAVLEINSSSLRKGCAETMPGAELIKLYVRAGGSFVTLGSDAHDARDLASGLDTASALAEEFGLKQVVYVARQRRLPRDLFEI